MNKTGSHRGVAVITTAEFFGDPVVLEELAPIYCAEMVSTIVPVVMGMLLARETGGAAPEEKLSVLHDDLRRSIPLVLRWMGDPDNIERHLDRMIDDGISQSRKTFPAVDAFMRGEFDQFFQQIAPSFQVPESG